MERIKGFSKDVSKEIKKVHWLSKKEVASRFVVVHVIAAVISLYFGGIDFLFNTVKNLIG